MMPNQLQPSPSGRFFLEITETEDGRIIYWSFRVLSAEKAVVYQCEEKFDIRHSTIMMWDNDDRVWVYSGDLGVYIWEMQGDETDWQQIEYSQSGLTPPEALVKAKPRIFKKR